MGNNRGMRQGSIKKRTDGRYEVRVTAGLDFKTGLPHRISKYARTKTEASHLLKQLLYAYDVENLKAEDITLYEWLHCWLESLLPNQVKQSTFISYRGYVENHFKPALGKQLLRNITPQILRSFYRYKREQECLSAKTVINMNLCLHRALEQAVQERIIPNNPASKLNLKNDSKPEIQVFSRSQQEALIRASYGHRYGVFIRLTLVTGLRIGELLALTWDDIDIKEKMLTVRHTLNRLQSVRSTGPKTEIVISTPKTKNSCRNIPLIDPALNDLLAWRIRQQEDRTLAGSAYQTLNMVVSNPLGGYIEPSTFRDYYREILTQANLPRFTFHALRHTFATRALEQGMDAKTLSSILGHYSVSFTLDTYAHVLDPHKRENLNLLTSLYIPNEQKRDARCIVLPNNSFAAGEE